MKSLEYIKTQAHRLSEDQRDFVQMMDEFPDGSSPTKTDEERLAQMYLWLHMESGTIAHRRFSSSLSMKGRRHR